MPRSAAVRSADEIDVQDDVLAFLSTPAAYGLPEGTPIERIDTHISIVWLAGTRAYKVKRAVRFGYVDFSHLDLRRAACEAEVRVNQRTAPSLYVGVRPVTRSPEGVLAIGGCGTPVEWLIEMVRFDQEALFDRLAERGRLDLALMDGLADAIVRLHSGAEPRCQAGGRDGMAWVVDGNALAFESLASRRQRRTAERIVAGARAAIDRHTELLERRRLEGAVRCCHGDLHLRNICLIDGRPTLFDAIEFNSRISTVDVLYDFAFLLMDLWHRRLPGHANALFNAYLSQTVDIAGLALLPLFLSTRAAVLAKVNATAARVQTDRLHQERASKTAEEYLALAAQLIEPPPPSLIVIGGYSGAGKSTLARGLAPGVGAVPGALVLRSDAIRKQLLGVAPLTRLPREAYTPEMSRHVYQTLAGRAAVALVGGHAVIADAVYANQRERDEILSVAAAVGVPLSALWLDAPEKLLATRLARRLSDVSDATPAILAQQVRAGAPPGDWQRIDAAAGASAVLARAQRLAGVV